MRVLSGALYRSTVWGYNYQAHPEALAAGGLQGELRGGQAPGQGLPVVAARPGGASPELDHLLACRPARGAGGGNDARDVHQRRAAAARLRRLEHPRAPAQVHCYALLEEQKGTSLQRLETISKLCTLFENGKS